jgi:hypothetical protein
MTWRREQLLEDRHIRDAARAVVEADVANLRAALSAKSLGERAVDRIAEGANDVYDEALEVAADNKGALAAIVAALLLWFARHPIREALFGEEEDTGEAGE